MKPLHGLIIMLCICMCSCQQHFNKSGWTVEDDLGTYPNRDGMVADLIKHIPLRGSSRWKVIDLLGQPDETDAEKMYYTIILDYGSDIDPVAGKDLVPSFNKDSIIANVNIDEWKH